MTKRQLLAGGLLVLVVNAGWVWAFPEANLFYVANVLLHAGLGVVLLAALAMGAREAARWLGGGGWAAVLLLLVCGALGLALCYIGATQPNMPVVIAHGALGFAGALAAGVLAWRRGLRYGRLLIAALAVALGLPAAAWVRAEYFPPPDDRVNNPLWPPASMDYEGGGKGSPFFPSSAITNTGGLIPSEFFLDSAVCGDCHKDIYAQWQSSMHRFSSFNNQFYRKSIEYMQDVLGGAEESKWCAGCHDHAMFFNGRFEKPAIEQIDTPEAQAGLGCLSCHAVTAAHSTMGNADFRMEYPPLHELASSGNPVIRTVHDYVTNTAPAAHRRAFLKPFMVNDSAQFCSTCHKVHLDVPVNHYRWFRGFNEYDAWQASGVSGMGARSFYYPAAPQSCNDCHMPLVRSNDPGNDNGYVRSHRFAAANTAVAYVNQDEQQLRETIEFLQDDIVTVDIFAVTPVEEDPSAPEMIRRAGDIQAATTFAVGEESASRAGPVLLREVEKIAAPVDRAGAVIRPGEAVRVDVVVRTRKVGHFFPGGTVDAFDVWLELRAQDASGRDIFWSGRIEDGGQGPVEKGAHFYRSFLLDAHGNPINKRNAFHARSLLYARLIPPGAADVAHFRLEAPDDVKGPIRLEAKLNYRKFSHFYTQFSYAGQPKPGSGGFGRGHDDREFTFHPGGIPENVSGKIRGRIPNLPVVEIARDVKTFALNEGAVEWKPVVNREDYERWNDYGIGLLLQGDLKGAEFAFQRVTEANPDYADGWINIARALIEEGRTAEARPYLEKAREIDGSLGRIYFFLSQVQRAEGDYDAALESLRRVERQYPQDRVALNQIATILFRQRNYEQALAVLDRVARIDPEDLQMHYTRMLCYRGLGDTEKAELAETLFRRFKADESAQTITARIRQISPEDNNERQLIHEHVSAPLEGRSERDSKAPHSAGGGM